MNLKILPHMSEPLLFFNLINEIDVHINTIIEDKYYGDAIAKILVAIICVDTIFDDFFKPRRTRLGKDQFLSIEFKMDFHSFLNSNEAERVDLILAELKKIPNIIGSKKIKNFDINSFTKDFNHAISSFRMKEILYSCSFQSSNFQNRKEGRCIMLIASE
jgi:Immunity protein 44